MEIQVGNKMMEVTLLSKEGNNVSIELDGEVYNVDISMLENNVCSIINNGISYNAELSHNDSGKHYRVNLNYSVYEIDMLDSQAKYMRLRKNHNASAQEQNDNITAPMPCKIVKVYVKPGDELKAGDTVLTMEAMKMQSNYKVTADCTVDQVLVNEGDSVMANQTMVVVHSA